MRGRTSAAKTTLQSEQQDDQARVTRRSLLSWLGNATVLSLTPQGVVACSDATDSSSAVGPGAGGAAAAAGAGEARPGRFEFAPGDRSDSIYQGWEENTVDPQSLEELLASWVLRVDGMVREPREFAFSDLIALARHDQIADFHCVEGWSVFDVPWNGVHLRTLLEYVGANPEATYLTFYCAGGRYVESIPITVAQEPKTMLAYGIGNSTLPLRHGFPARLVVPRLYGYKSAKYVERIEVSPLAKIGFWEERGYSYEAEVPAARLREGRY